VRVEPVASQGDEEIAWLERARVGDDASNFAAAIAAPDQPVNRLSHPPQRQPEVSIAGSPAGITQPAT